MTDDARDAVASTACRRILVAQPHGFCSGVARAVESLKIALRLRPRPIYCLNAIVHNRQVVEQFSRHGVRFVETLADVPPGNILFFPAHGVAPSVRKQALARNLHVIDATCPFVAKVHAEVRRYACMGFTIFLIGDRNHDEVIGVAGEAPEKVIIIETEQDIQEARVPDPKRVVALTQTTLSLDSVRTRLDLLRNRFSALKLPSRSDICYATHNRQQAARAVAARAELTLVLGSPSSANSRRLVEVCEAAGCPSKLLADRHELVTLDLETVRTLGLTSGASTPEAFLTEILKDLRGRGFTCVESMTVTQEKQKRFPLPNELLRLLCA